MFALIDFFSLDKWIEVGKQLGVGTMFALFLLFLLSWGTLYIFRACFGKLGFVRAFFAAVQTAAIDFLNKLTTTLDRLETSAAETRDFHKNQSAVCQMLYKAHMDPHGVCNLSEIRSAAGHGLDALTKIGDAVGADVARDVAAAKDILIA